MFDIFFVSIIVLIFGYPVYLFLTRKKRKLKKKLKRRRKHLHLMMEACSNEFKVSDIWEAYRENEIAADRKYIGKIVFISGRITRITRIESRDLFAYTGPVMLISHTDAHVQCNMYEADDEPLRDLRTNDQISVYGAVDSFSIDVGDRHGFVLLTSCIIPPTEEEKQDGSQ